MDKGQGFLKARLGQVSAKTLSLAGKKYVRSRNEQKIKYAEAFTYTSLSSSRNIRLLKIKPAEDTEVVSCELVEVDLDSKPQYEAVSYTWDLDPEWSLRKLEVVEDTIREERPILLNGKPLHVTMNLYHALTELRRRKWDKMLWVDQICINQQNNEEKVFQLKLMTDIYSSALTVIIWLGKTSKMKNSALDYMEAQTDQKSHPLGTVSNSFTSLVPGNKDAQKHKPNTISRPFDTVTKFMSSMADHYHVFASCFVIGAQWFRRAWTIQEIFLSTEFRIIMGDRDIDSDSIVRAALHLLDFWGTDSLALQSGVNVTILDRRNVLLQRVALFDERKKFLQGKRYSAQEYLALIRTRIASVPKDKLFAGVALLEGGALTSVDYNCTTLEIYLGFATERLLPEAKIFILSLVGGTEPTIEGLPTWVPDLNAPLRPLPLQQCGSPTLKTPIPVEGVPFHVEGKHLLIKVAVWDVVNKTGETDWSWTRYDDEPYNTLSEQWKMRTSGSVSDERFGLMFSMLDDLGTSYAPTGERTVDAFWQTLIGGTNIQSGESLEVWRDRFRRWFAFVLVDIRQNFWDEEHAGKWSSRKKWMVPLIADQGALEERVAKFLDFHDQELETVDGAEKGPQLLRSVIASLMKRIYGAETIAQVTGWKGTMEVLGSILNDKEFYNPISKFAEHFVSAYAGRRLITTKNGYLGISTESVKAGDLICHVAGATVPYVLRPVTSKEGTFTLVGEAYIHGAMREENMVGGDLKFESVSIV